MFNTDPQTLENQTPENIFPDLSQLQIVSNTEHQVNVNSLMASLADILLENRTLEESNDISEKYRQQFLEGQEEGIRLEFDQKRRNHRRQSFERFSEELLTAEPTDDNIELLRGGLDLITAKEEEIDNYALEKTAIESLTDLAARDPVQADLLMRNYEKGDTVEQITAFLQKSAIYRNEIDKVQKELEEQGLLSDITDFIGFFNPVIGTTSEIGNVPLSDDEFDDWWVRTGERLIAEQNKLFYETTLDEFQELLPEVVQSVKDSSGFFSQNRSRIVANLENLQALKGTYGSRKLHSIISGVDVGLSVLPAGALLGKLKSPYTLAKASFNREVATKIAATKLIGKTEDTVNTLDRVVSFENTLDEVLPSNLVPTRQLVSDVGLSGDITKEIEDVVNIRNNILQINRAQKLTDDEIKAVISSETAKAKNRFGDLAVKDVKQIDDDTSSLIDLRIQVGKAKGGGYSTEKSALNAANRKKLSDRDFEIVEDTSGQFFIEIKQIGDETGVIKPVDLKDIGAETALTAYIKSGTSTLPKFLSEQVNVSGFSREAIYSNVVKPLIKKVEKVNKRGQEGIRQVLNVGQSRQKWFTQAEFETEFERAVGRRPNKNEIVGYYTMKEVNDLDWFLHNRSEYERLASKGTKQFTFKDFDTNLNINPVVQGRKIETLSDPEARRFYDINNNAHYPKGSLTRQEFDKLINEEGYTVLKLEGSPLKTEVGYVDNILVKRNSILEEGLDPIQLGYTPGGHRLYRGKYFGKQARVGSYTDTGEKYVLNPLTHIVGTTKKQVDDWTSSMEEARLAYKEFLENQTDEALEAAEEAIAKTDIGTVEDWETAIREGKISQDTPFETVFDREELKFNSSLDSADKVTGGFTPESSISEWYYTNRKSVFGRKGEHLPDPYNNPADLLDPYLTASKGLQSAINTGALDTWRTSAIERWVATAKSQGAFESRFDDLSPIELFRRGPKAFRTGLDKNVASQLNGFYSTIRRNLSASTVEGDYVKMRLRKFAEWVGESNTPLSVKALDMMDSNPVNAVRGIAFDLKLGLFNVGQIILQSQTAVAAATISPKYGSRAMFGYYPLRLTLANESDNVLDYVAKKFKPLHGLEPDEYKLMVKELRRSGIMDVGGGVVQLDQFSTNFASTNLSKTARGVQESGRFFFYEAEKINRSVAYQIAWKEFREQFPKKSITSGEGRGWIAKRTDDLTQNMTSQSAAGWQKGVATIPTQFLSYQARLLENVMPVILGGSKKFTPAEKLRLAAGQLILYGTAGLPLADWVKEQVLNATGAEISYEQAALIERGFADQILESTLFGGVDTNFADSAGTGAGWSDYVEKLFSGEFVDVLGGPSYTIGSDIVGTFAGLHRAVQFMDSGEVYLDKLVLEEVLSNVSSWSRFRKAQYILEQGKVVNRQGTIEAEVPDHLRSSAALASFLGIQLNDVSQAWELIKDTKSTRDDIEVTVKQIRKYMLDTVQNPDKAEFNGKVISSLLNGFSGSEEEKAELRRRAAQGLDGSLLNKALIQNRRIKGITNKNRTKEDQ